MRTANSELRYVESHAQGLPPVKQDGLAADGNRAECPPLIEMASTWELFMPEDFSHRLVTLETMILVSVVPLLNYLWSAFMPIAAERLSQ